MGVTSEGLSYAETQARLITEFLHANPQHRVNHLNRSAAHGDEPLSTSVDKNPSLYLHQE
jgi:hypothetical protein